MTSRFHPQNSDSMKLHEKIRFLRQVKSWTQEDVAEKLGMSANGYGSIERGETDICLSRLEKIADVFGVDLTSLISCGDKIVYQMRDNSSIGVGIGEHASYNQAIDNQIELKHELEKKDLLLTERDKEIVHLKEIIGLLKRQRGE